MFCTNCGSQLTPGATYCTQCGLKINNKKVSNNNNQLIKIGLYCATGLFLLVIFFIIIFKLTSNNVYLSDNNYQRDNTPINTSSKNSFKNTTIDFETQTTEIPTNKTDAISLIVKDSNEQKKKCQNSKINNIENELINSYDIKAVNLCELDIDFAIELLNVIKTVNNDFPMIKGHLSNLYLGNPSTKYIAAFYAEYPFATQNGYPLIFKTMIVFNDYYYLNTKIFATSIKRNVQIGHFPPNATIYSPFAHELAHYLDFLIAIKMQNLDNLLFVTENQENNIYYFNVDYQNQSTSLMIINEAYTNYKTKNPSTNLTMDDFRATISGYAMAKNEENEYLYSETIAEAYHDYYNNRGNAKPASLEIVDVLKKYLDLYY